MRIFPSRVPHCARTLLSFREKSVRRDEDHDEAQRARMYMQQDRYKSISHWGMFEAPTYFGLLVPVDAELIGKWPDAG